ncbi:MAG: hypothetical protein IPO95_08665 [Rhodanobacteraceae bacterium]|nr:hypothetical protein [Rhodanobacteraceae bacterium]
MHPKGENAQVVAATEILIEATSDPLPAGEAADWLAHQLWEQTEQAGQDVLVMYHCGQLSRSPEKLALSIEVRTDVGCVLLVEDVFGRFWISCSSESAAKAPARSFRAGDEMESWVKRGLDALTGEAGRDRADRATGRTRASHWH